LKQLLQNLSPVFERCRSNVGQSTLTSQRYFATLTKSIVT